MNYFNNLKKKIVISFLVTALAMSGACLGFCENSYAGKSLTDSTFDVGSVALNAKDDTNIVPGALIIPAKLMRKAPANLFVLKEPNIPSKYRVGDKFVLTGSISGKQKIRYIRVGITKPDNTWLKDHFVEKAYNKRRSRLRAISFKKLVDNQIDFQTLTKGEYKFVVYARTEKGKGGIVAEIPFNAYVPKPFEIEDVAKPAAFYKGSSFKIDGVVRTTIKMRRLQAAVYNSEKKKVNAASVNPDSKTYRLNKLSSKLQFEKIDPGKYKYTVEAVNIAGEKKVLVDDSFYVSQITGTNIKKPLAVAAGKGFVVQGKLESAFKINKLVIGVKYKSTGNFANVAYEEINPNKKTYDLNNLDRSLKFSKLSPGDYVYYISATDSKGIEKIILEHDFTVKKPEAPAPVPDDYNPNNTNTGEVPSSEVGKKLSYNKAVFNKIGAQPYSGPCGLYAMAYGRLVIDGDFPLGEYKTYISKLLAEYGNNSVYAHWEKAYAASKLTASAKSAYALAFRTINEGKPVIMPINNGYTGNNHFITLIGYVKGTTAENVSLSSFIALDPGRGKEVKLADMKYFDKPNSSARAIIFYK